MSFLKLAWVYSDYLLTFFLIYKYKLIKSPTLSILKTCLSIFCSLRSFCRSLSGSPTCTSNASTASRALRDTKNIRSSSSLITNLVENFEIFNYKLEIKTVNQKISSVITNLFELKFLSNFKLWHKPNTFFIRI